MKGASNGFRPGTKEAHALAADGGFRVASRSAAGGQARQGDYVAPRRRCAPRFASAGTRTVGDAYAASARYRDGIKRSLVLDTARSASQPHPDAPRLILRTSLETAPRGSWRHGGVGSEGAAPHAVRPELLRERATVLG